MKYLLSGGEHFYKAALHTHSTVSDGKMTPEEVKASYKAKGFQILALSDHELCIPHPELNDEDFLTLTAYEIMTYEAVPRMNARTYHINMIAKTPDNRWQFYHPNLRAYIAPWVDQLVYDEPHEREYSVAELNALIKKANEKGFLCFYNHPVWSLQKGEDYLELKGLWGVEVFNYGAYRSGYDEDANQCYQELLKAGNHLCPVASDDSHKEKDIGGGWTMIGAEALEYGAVIEAMEKGNVYASSGPAIHSIAVDGDRLLVTCSEAANVNFVTHGRNAGRRFAKEGQLLTEAEFSLAYWMENVTEDWKENAFFRICVTDAHGKKAWSRPYYLKDLA